MKKYLLSLWIATALMTAVVTSCTNDPKVDNMGTVNLLQTDLRADVKGAELAINVTSNAYWHIEFTTTDGAAVRWITADITNGMGDAVVTLKVDRNRTGAEREALIVLTTDSQSVSKSITLTQGGDGSVDVAGYSLPIYDLFQIGEGNTFINGYIQDNDCVFDNGLIITRTGTMDANLTFACPCHLTSNYQRGLTAGYWETGNAWEFEIPVKDELSGKLRFLFGSRRDNITGSNPWTIEWSGNNESWTIFDGAISTGSDAVWKFIDFTIPAEKKIPAGGKLWIRMTPSDVSKIGSSSIPTALFQHGLCITNAEAPKSSVPASDKETIVFSTGFDDIVGIKAAYIELPLDFMTSCHGGVYALPKELADVVSVAEGYTRPGYLQLNGGNGAPGKYTIKLSHLTAMNISKSDLKVTFNCSSYLGTSGEQAAADVCVKVDALSGASVENEGKIEGLEIAKFKEVTAIVRNATPETTLTITNNTEAKDSRFFIDDIVVKVEGTPVRPDADDPTKINLSELRAKKGIGAVTIADNNYIQGRVVSTDNVPAGSFAIADENAGIFVRAAAGNFTAGDMVKVVVKTATLEADANGLLTLIPTAADKVTKVDVVAVMPTPKAISVADLTVGTYEAMYVELPASQVVATDLSKTMSEGRGVTLELGDQMTTYTMKTFAGASFAGQNLPQKSGVVKGLAGVNALLPTAMTDLAGMTGARFGQTVYGITPIAEFLIGDPTTSDADKYYQIINATHAENSKTMTFTASGNTITKIGGKSDDKCWIQMQTNLYNGVFISTGWGGSNYQDNGLVFKLKATSRLVGNLRFGFGMFVAAGQNVPKNYKISWSNDNTNWNEGAKVGVTPYAENTFEETFQLGTSPTAAPQAYKMAYFNVPESKAVEHGNYIYIKIKQADNESRDGGEINPTAELRFVHGCYLSTHEMRAYHTSTRSTGANIILTEGFDDAFWGHDYFTPSRQLFANLPANYTAPIDWKTTETKQCPGYILIGSTATKGGTLVTPALTALGDTPTDIIITFKAACYLSPTYKSLDAKSLSVSVSGSGTVQGQPDFSALSGVPTDGTTSVSAMELMDVAYYKWYDQSIRVTGATKDTQITFKTSSRHFIDEIVITKN